jgi:hypothetical protein
MQPTNQVERFWRVMSLLLDVQNDRVTLPDSVFMISEYICHNTSATGKVDDLLN